MTEASSTPSQQRRATRPHPLRDAQMAENLHQNYNIL
ncbi:hypothetical protein A2U01_0096027, partial [Trifolium medium]|nr:hypothetical protein [Trifolium medium]